MKNLKHPAFLLGVVSIIILLIGIIFYANGNRAGSYIMIASVILGGIHWIWSIIDVASRTDMKPFQKRFWLIAVVAAPAMGSMIFYIMHQAKGKIAT